MSKSLAGTHWIESTPLTDLASRRSGRYEIALLRNGETGALTVSVRDDVTGVECELPVRADEALDVFHHPFAHPALRRVPFLDHRTSAVG
jgi:hypothetical protein